jgi:hypothetical protein
MFLEIPIISSIGSPCYSPAGFLHNMLYPLVARLKLGFKKIRAISAVSPICKCSRIRYTRKLDVGHFTNVPAEQVLEIIGNKLLESDKLAQSSVLEVDAIME